MGPGLILLLPGSLVFLAWLPPACPTYCTGKIKPGTCPVLQSDDKVYGKYCSQDSNCPGNEKCCKSSYGKQCVLPDRVFSGYCPEVSLYPGQVTDGSGECTDDYACARALPKPQKCCSVGCWRLCMEATEEHPGVCPLMPVVNTYAPCKPTCRDDRQCPLSQKCCFTGCSRGCLDSVRSEQCRLPPETGPCKVAGIRYYYSPDEKKCLTFTYGGCHGNSNNFKTEEECEKTCGKVSPGVCEQPPKSGSCLAHKERYYYNSTLKSCKVFNYGGCGGNDNRFHTKLECLMACGKPDKCIVQ